jgi:hypothetical protein
VVEFLPNNHEALSSSSTTDKERERDRDRDREREKESCFKHNSVIRNIHGHYLNK